MANTEEHVEILKRELKKLKRSRIAIVNVRGIFKRFSTQTLIQSRWKSGLEFEGVRVCYSKKKKVAEYHDTRSSMYRRMVSGTYVPDDVDYMDLLSATVNGLVIMSMRRSWLLYGLCLDHAQVVHVSDSAVTILSSHLRLDLGVIPSKSLTRRLPIVVGQAPHSPEMYFRDHVPVIDLLVLENSRLDVRCRSTLLSFKYKPIRTPPLLLSLYCTIYSRQRLIFPGRLTAGLGPYRDRTPRYERRFMDRLRVGQLEGQLTSLLSFMALLPASRKNGTKMNQRSTRVPPVTPAPTTTTVTEAQLQALIDQGVAAAMAEAEASRVRNGYNSNGSGPRPAQTARECSYFEFLKCKPLDFKGTEGVEVIGFTTMLMEDKTHAYAERQAERKRKYDDLSMSCHLVNNCKKVGHLARDWHMGCLSAELKASLKRNCQGLRKHCPWYSQAGNDRAPAKVYVVGNVGANPDNVVAEDIPAFPGGNENLNHTLMMEVIKEMRQIKHHFRALKRNKYTGKDFLSFLLGHYIRGRSQVREESDLRCYQ
ncbi:hypothetical protein Tco_0295792 [Tanacetum coccineum]